MLFMLALRVNCEAIEINKYGFFDTMLKLNATLIRNVEWFKGSFIFEKYDNYLYHSLNEGNGLSNLTILHLNKTDAGNNSYSRRNTSSSEDLIKFNIYLAGNFKIFKL